MSELEKERQPVMVETSSSTAVPEKSYLELPRFLTVKELAEITRISPIEVIKELMKNGIMAAINQTIDFDTAAVVASDLGFEVAEKKEPITDATAAGADLVAAEEDDPSLLRPRPPVVTVLGHVDHGKTSLLDAIRQTNIIASEAGGITQHIGAYQVEVQGQKITFLDTPGHEAFTAMRARGAQATDIAVLVVAADDGVMPQTEEAISHARAAGVPIIVAINKIDKPDADPERVKRQLAERSLLIEEWGGDVICVPVSAKSHQGIEDLLSNILVVAEVADLKANPHRSAKGVVIEAEMDKNRGPVATVLVQNGALKQGDVVVAGGTYGRVKAMFNDKGKRIKRAEPAIPAEILGLSGIPLAGDSFAVVADERIARAQVSQQELRKAEEAVQLRRALTLDDLYAQVQEGKVKELNIILKTDVQGSIEPIASSLTRLSSDQVKVKILHNGTGSITESDVFLALASKGIIIGFNTRVEPGARRLAESEGVDIRLYEIIYHLVEDVEKALTGMLEPVIVEVVEGHGEVRQVFKIGRHQAVVGIYINDGRVGRNSLVRVRRGNVVLADSTVDSLRRFKDDVREVVAGFECGLGLDDFSAFEMGDILEFYRKELTSPGKAPASS